MAIFVPGKRNRHGRQAPAKRSVVAVLSLTAMVDLFTVLVVFLLQNYATTGAVLEIPEGVKLPDAREVKDLKPANVVIVSFKEVKLNNDFIAEYQAVKDQQDWMIEPLRDKIQELIKKGEDEKAAIANRLRSAVDQIRDGEIAEEEVDAFRKMTIQADKDVDFMTLKKVMYTVTEAGVSEMNFAVLKRPDEAGN